MPFYKVNILGVFLISILGMFLFDKFKQKNRIFWLSFIILYFTGSIILDFFGVIPEGLWGIMLPLIFYLFRDKKIAKYIAAGVVLVSMSSMAFIDGVQGFIDFRQFFSLLALILIAFYNGEKGRLNLKYLFYVGYPSHLAIIYMLLLII